MLTVAEASARSLAGIQPLGTERVPLLDAGLGLETENREDGVWAPLLRALPMLFVPAHLITLALVLSRVGELGPGW